MTGWRAARCFVVMLAAAGASCAYDAGLDPFLAADSGSLDATGATLTLDGGIGGSGGALPIIPSPSPTIPSEPGPAEPEPSSDPSGECRQGQKRCGGICVAPAPPIGCALTGCDPCPPAPTNAEARCENSSCSWACATGYTEVDATCIPAGSGGSGGAPPGGSSGGTSPLPATGGSAPETSSCNASACPGCSVIGPFPCCRSNGTCGCTWAPGAYCL